MRAHYATWWESVAPGLNEPLRVTIGHDAEPASLLSPCEWRDVFLDQGAQVRRGERKNGVWHLDVARAGEYEFELRRWPRERETPLERRPAAADHRGRKVPRRHEPAHRRGAAQDRRFRPHDERGGSGCGGEVSRPACRRAQPNCKPGFSTLRGQELCGAYYVYARRLHTAPPVKLILDTDMSGDCDDAGTLALLHTLADRGECELLATVVNRKDKTGASAAAVDAINTYYGRPNLPIGTDKQGPTDLQRTSAYTRALRDEFPNDIGPDDRAPDALDVYRRRARRAARRQRDDLQRRRALEPRRVVAPRPRTGAGQSAAAGGDGRRVSALEIAGDQHPHPSRGGAVRRRGMAGRNHLARIRSRERAHHRRAV